METKEKTNIYFLRRLLLIVIIQCHDPLALYKNRIYQN